MVKSNLVPKKDGSLSAGADLRKVNKCVVADSYAMPDTQELLDQLAESEVHVHRSELCVLAVASR